MCVALSDLTSQGSSTGVGSLALRTRLLGFKSPLHPFPAVQTWPRASLFPHVEMGIGDCYMSLVGLTREFNKSVRGQSVPGKGSQ